MTSTDAPRRAVIYTRLSQDRNKGTDSEGIGTDKQETECRALAATLGLEVLEPVRQDNDTTAYKGTRRSKPREGYEALLDDIRSGRAGAVIAWHTDRLHRNLTELETYIDACEPREVPTYTVKGGHLDLSTANGQTAAGIFAAIAKGEVKHMIERQRNAKDRARLAGEWQGGPRPFGFAVVPKLDDQGNPVKRRNGGVVHTIRPHPVEAHAVREAYTRLLAGEGLNTIARDWNARGLQTPKHSAERGGRGFHHSSLRTVLWRASNAGLIEHDGEIVGQGQWEKIVSEDTWRAARALLSDRARSATPGPKPVHLLTGVLVCGVCKGTTFRVVTTGSGRHQSYSCDTYSLRDDGVMRINACVGRNAGRLDEYVGWVIVERLRQPQVVQALNAHPTVDIPALDARREVINAELNEIAVARFSVQQKALQSGPLLDELEQLDRQISEALRPAALPEFAGTKDAAAVWDGLPIERKRAVARLLLRVIVMPTRKGRPPGWKVGQPHELDHSALKFTNPDGTPWGDPD